MKTIRNPAQSEIKIKKSEFICRLFPTKTKQESKEIINKVSNEFSDATHNCTAYITINGEGYDDNGEPSGTAGKPMINALRKNELSNITAIVTRYFGGIKLGAGGLVRAYSKAVLNTIEKCEIIDIEYYDVYTVIFDYSLIKDIESEIRNNKLKIINQKYEEKISYDLISAKNINIETLFEKYNEKIDVSFKNKQALEKI